MKVKKLRNLFIYGLVVAAIALLREQYAVGTVEVRRVKA